MELIDRYVAEVGRHLPENLRPDIEEEIRSLLEDNLEDRSSEQGRQPDEEMVVDVLKAYGKPEKVAATYLPQRYLIGPRLYPTFMKALRILLLVAMIVCLIQFGFSIIQSTGGLAHLGFSLLEALGTFLNAVLMGLGVMVVVFSILEWKAPRRLSELTGEEEDWDPRKLERVPPPAERVKTGPMLVETIFSLVALLLFAFYSDRIGLYAFIGERWIFAPVMTQTFYNLLPFILGVWGLGILLNLVVLRQGRWQPFTRWIYAGITLLNLSLIIVMLAGAPIVEMTPAAVGVLQSLNLDAGAEKFMESGLVKLVRMILSILLIVEGLDLGTTVYRLLRKKPAEGD